MKYKTLQEIETRKAAILQEMEQEGADLEALKKETEELRANAQQIRDDAAKAEETRKASASGAAGIVVGEAFQTKEKKTDEEIRSSAEYSEAYKKYIMTGDDRECRTLLSTNATAATGYVPVPTYIDDMIKTAWESNELLNRVNKTNFRGNLKVPFEKSADSAYVHGEGTTGLTEEDLQLGIVELKPENIKKWIKISDEAVALGGEAFVRYIYNEIIYRVLNKLVAELVADVTSAGTSHTTSAIGIPKVSEAPGVMTIADAAANLSDEANNICVVMNRLTEQQFNAAYAAANFAIDPYAGLPRVYTSALPAYSTASANATYAFVGDLKALQVNYPEGEGVIVKWDELTLAEDDLVKVVGRQFAGHDVTAPGCLVRLTKPSGSATT